MEKQLTAEEQNFIKDILRAIGNDSILTTMFVAALDMESSVQFNEMADKIFEKLQNGRVTVQEG